MSAVGLDTIWMGLNNLRLHKLRSLLTALGLIFGVGAVICMLSVTEGASADELRMIQRLGTRNIIVNSVKPQQALQAAEGNVAMLEFGITREDVGLIEATVPHVSRLVPLRTVAYSSRRRDRRFEGQVVGVTPEFFATVKIGVSAGRMVSDADMRDNKQVCVLGQDAKSELFAYEDPLRQTILVERHEATVAYEVVGVLNQAVTAGTPAKGVEERNLNREIYIPLSTAETRYGEVLLRRQSGSRELLKFDYSGLYVTAESTDYVVPVSEMVKRVLECNHEKMDYEVRVPLARLQLLERKKRNSQIQLGLIAGISLLVGGIGIMNIMLATVTERTREIGIRRALGARQRDIVVQFLIETVILSTTGGVCGVVLGFVGSTVMTSWAEWGEAIVRPEAVAISFGLSVFVGIFFGMYPALRAAKLDPIEALRHE